LFVASLCVAQADLKLAILPPPPTTLFKIAISNIPSPGLFISFIYHHPTRHIYMACYIYIYIFFFFIIITYSISVCVTYLNKLDFCEWELCFAHSYAPTVYSTAACGVHKSLLESKVSVKDLHHTGEKTPALLKPKETD
jgi:hypothetical protein